MGKQIENEVSRTRDVSQWKLIPDRSPVSKGNGFVFNIVKN
jgi:hypothetical protein